MKVEEQEKEMDTYEVVVERNGETVFKCKTLAQIACKNRTWLHTAIDDKNIQYTFTKQKDLCLCGLLNFLQLLVDTFYERELDTEVDEGDER